MTRASYALMATLVGALCVGRPVSSAQAQSSEAPGQPKAPEMKQILAGKKFVPPVKGEAKVDFIKSPTKREGTTLVTKIQVKNMSEAPIPRLTIDETWYDKNQNLIPGGKGVINGLLQPGEIQTIEVRTPVNPNMQTSMLQFSHANGTVKTHAVKSFDGAAPEPAKPAAKPKKK
jgi:hypothetical protein